MILVSGAAGNGGSHLVTQLLDAGEKARAVIRTPGSRFFPEQVEVVSGDLTHSDTLAEALDGVERAFLFPVSTGLAATDGTTAEMSPTVEEVTGRPAFTCAQWAAHHAAFGGRR